MGLDYKLVRLSHFWGGWDGSRHNDLRRGSSLTLSNHLGRTQWVWVTLLFIDPWPGPGAIGLDVSLVCFLGHISAVWVSATNSK